MQGINHRGDDDQAAFPCAAIFKLRSREPRADGDHALQFHLSLELVSHLLSMENALFPQHTRRKPSAADHACPPLDLARPPLLAKPAGNGGPARSLHRA